MVLAVDRACQFSDLLNMIFFFLKFAPHAEFPVIRLFLAVLSSASLKRSYIAVPGAALGRRVRAVGFRTDTMENLLTRDNDKKQANFSRFCYRL